MAIITVTLLMTHGADLLLLIGREPVVITPGNSMREEFIGDGIIPGFMTIGTDRQPVTKVRLFRMSDRQLVDGGAGGKGHNQQ